MKHPHLPLVQLLLFATVLSLSFIATAQTKRKDEAASVSSCTRENALNIIQQQIDATRTFDDEIGRISVLLRAGDLLWPAEQDRARAAFTEAFELAKVNFKEKGDEDRQVGRLMTGTPDQRYQVISAIARRDYPWAKKLIDQVLKEDADAAKGKTDNDPIRDLKTPGKILSMASSLVTTDSATAVNIARTSLGYSATLSLPIFLYRLAETNQPLADQFYQEALAAYRDKPMEEFLYLSAYPFGNKREAGEMPGYTYYRIPPNFAPNISLQRLFVQTLLRRAEHTLTSSSVANSANARGIMQRTDNEQIWLALTRLEKQIQQSLPDLAEAVQQAMASSFSAQSEKSQRDVTETISAQERPKKTFDERVEAADKERNPNERDQRLAFAVLGASATETLDHILTAIEKLDDPTLKEQLLTWVYFTRAQGALNLKQLDEARRLAARVGELDQRAYLFSEIAKEALNHAESQQQAREILDEVLTQANKAPNNTMATARTLLAVAYLYTKVDLGRAISTLGDAIKCINRIEAPDFSHQYVTRRIESKTFGSYANFQTPGFSPENVFRELGNLDFDGTLYQASNFSNKSLRSLTTLALVEGCVQQTATPAKPAKPPKKSESKKSPKE